MIDRAKLIEKSKTSPFYLWLLNLGFNRLIPFNRPHGFRIIGIGDGFVRTMLPYKKANLNHLNGLHACALATLTELTAGFIFVTRLDPKQYRIILRKLEINYLYQGKTDAFGEFKTTDEWFEKNILGPLKVAEAVDVVSEVNIVDKNGNQLTSGKAFWQIKDWTKVMTKS